MLVQQNPQFGQLSPRGSDGDLAVGPDQARSRSSSQGHVDAQDDVGFVRVSSLWVSC